MTKSPLQSDRQIQYLKKQKVKKRMIQLARILLLLAFLLLWEFASRREIIDSFL